MQILDVRYDCMPSIKQVTCKSDYDQVQKYIYDKSNQEILIETGSDLDIQQKGNIVVFIDDWVCEVEVLEHGKRIVYKYEFKTGFVCDKGSIPPKLRSFVDNDDPHLLVGFYIHDANYACHFMSRSKTDECLRDMGRYKGASWWKAFKVYRAVWAFGSDAYKKDDVGIKKQKQWVNFKRYLR